MRKSSLVRRHPLSRGRITPKARTGIKRSPMKKHARPKHQTERIYGPKGRVAFVKSLGCVVCTAISPFFGLATAGHCHNAHTETGGMGRKADYTTIVPLCASHHRRYDEHRAPLDEPVIRQAIKDAAAEVERRWQAYTHRKSA